MSQPIPVQDIRPFFLRNQLTGTAENVDSLFCWNLSALYIRHSRNCCIFEMNLEHTII